MTNSFIDQIICRKMEDAGHDVIRAEAMHPWKDYFVQFELYGCKKCGYIFGADKKNRIFLLGSVRAVEKGQSCAFSHTEVTEYDGTKMACGDLIVKGIIE